MKNRFPKALQHLGIILLFTAGIQAQSITITSPANNAVVATVGADGKSPVVPITVTVSALPSLDHVEYFQDSIRMKFNGIVRSAPWGTTYYPGMEGDSTIALVAKAYDVFGTLLATSSAVTITTKYLGAVASILNVTPPVSGNNSFELTLNHPYGVNNAGTNTEIYVDGRIPINGIPSGMNTWQISSAAIPSPPPWGYNWVINTKQFRNGNHEVVNALWQDGRSTCPPYCPTGTITVPAASISTSTGRLTALGHPIATAQQINAITLTTSNVCPTGLTCDGATPYYGIYFDADHFQLAATAGGAAIVPSTQGTGNLIVAYKITNQYWCHIDGDAPCTVPETIGGTYPLAYSRQLVDFENGAAAMEMRPPWQEIFLTLGQSVDANGQSCLLAPTIMNTDGTTTAVAANVPVYTAQDDGGGTACATVNASTGLVTAAASIPNDPCKMSFNVACTSGACNGLPTVNIRVSVSSANLTYTFSKSGAVRSSYSSTDSLFLRTDTHVGSGNISNAPWAGQEFVDSGYSTLFSGDGQGTLGPTDPRETSCTNSLNRWNATNTIYQGRYTTFGLTTLLGNTYQVFPPRNIKAFLTDLNFDRHACVQSISNSQNSAGIYVATFQQDEINCCIGNDPNPQRLAGQREFTSLTVSGGTATFAGKIDFPIPAWDFTAGGALSTVRIVGAVTAGVNGAYKIASPTFNGLGQTTAFTFATTAANGTYNSGSDPAMELIYWPFGQGQAGVCTIPGGAASDKTQQTWDANLTSIVVSAGVGTVHWTSHGFSTGQVVYTWTVTSTGLYVADAITKIDNDTFTVPMPHAASLTYNSGTDPTLYFTNDCMLDNHMWTNLQSGMFGSLFAARSVTVLDPLQAGAYGNGFSAKNWNHDLAVSTGNLIYTGSVPPINPYGLGISPYLVLYDHWYPFIFDRQWNLEPFAGIVHHLDADYSTRCHSFSWRPECGGLRIAYGPPEAVLARMMWPLSTGVAGYMGYYNASAPDNTYALNLGTNNSGGIAHYNPFSANQYVPIALSNNVIARLEKYYLQPKINTPYCGPMCFTTARQSSYGRLLMVGSLGVMPTVEHVDFGPYKYVGGSITRYAVNPRYIKVTVLSNALSGEDYTFNQHDDLAETVFYKFTPSATDPDLTTLTIPAPTLPTGATKMAYRLNYYLRAVDEVNAVDCTAGCSIVVDKSRTGAAIRWFYLGSDNSVKYAGEPQRL